MRTVQAELRRRGWSASSDLPRPHGRGPDGCRRSRLGPGGELQRREEEPPAEARSGPQLTHRTRRRRVLSAVPAGDFDARRDARSRTLLPGAGGAHAESLRGRRSLPHWPHRIEQGALAACGEALPGRMTSRRSPRPRQTTSASRRDILRAEWLEKAAGARVGAGSRALDRGGRLHAQHGAGAGGHDARGAGEAPADPRGLQHAARGAPRDARVNRGGHGLHLASVRY